MTKQRAYQVRQWFNGRCPRCGGIRDQVYAECSTCRGKRTAIYQRYNRKRRTKTTILRADTDLRAVGRRLTASQYEGLSE